MLKLVEEYKDNLKQKKPTNEAERRCQRGALERALGALERGPMFQIHVSVIWSGLERDYTGLERGVRGF